MTTMLPTQAEVQSRYLPLRVVDGWVADGPFAGSSATREARWDCIVEGDYLSMGPRCFWQDGWLVHNRRCTDDNALPPKPLPLPGPYEARQIGYAELVASGHLDPVPWNGGYDSWTATRQARAARGGDAA